MKIKELSREEFDNYARLHPFNNYCQNSKYAIVMTEYGYNYDFIGMVDDVTEEIKAAGLILTKQITGKAKYGYCPRGFLVNYFDPNILNEFVRLVREHYKQKNFIFIKFNPEIIIGQTDKEKKYLVEYNGNVSIIDKLKSLNVKRRMELKEFDLLLPKFTPFIDLKEYDISKLKREYRKKINHGTFKGLSLVVGGPKDVEIMYEFIKNNNSKPLSFYRNMYNIYSKDNAIDLVYVKLDYEVYLNNVRKKYEKELDINDACNRVIQVDPRRKNLNKKQASDQKLQKYKDQILEATEKLKKTPVQYVAGALVIKNSNKIYILESGFSKDHKQFNPNHFLYHSIMERYKPYFDYCDMNGVSGNFDETSEYAGLNKFKLDFNPTVYEYIGEFDLICSEFIFKSLIKTNFIENEFTNDKK